MDSDSITVNKRIHKTYDGPDLISNLPDCVISHLLSFLPIKDAVRTCVLSTRWKYLWTFMIELSFNDKNIYKKSSFVKSIDRVLSLLNSKSIHSFKLSVTEKIYNPYHINRWISALSCRKVKKLYFKSDYRSDSYMLSNTLFKCHSLEELHLSYCTIQIPNRVSLSSLTVLKLNRIEIYSAGDPSNKLTLNLPSLKEYEQKNCNWLGVKMVSFEVPLLEVLRIKSYNNAYNLREMEFSAVTLTRLYYYGYELKITIDLLAVHVASAEIFLIDSRLPRGQGLMDFVCKLVTTNVQRLKLYVKYPQDFVEMEYPSFGIPSLGMLVHLELDNFPTKFLIDLLLKAPCLQTLILKSLSSVKELLNFAIVPDSFLYTLKVVKFEEFQGDEQELNIAKFLVENSKVLERISFSYSDCYKGLFPFDGGYWLNWTKEKLEKDKEKLLSFKRSSSLAIMEFLCSS